MAQLNQPLVSNLPSFSALSSINLVSTRLPQANPRPLVHRLVSNSSLPLLLPLPQDWASMPLLVLVS